MKNSKSKRTMFLAILLVGLLIVGYKVVLVPPTDDLLAEEDISASERVESVLREVESINFDTSVVNDSKFASLKSIEIPLMTSLVGRQNPFSAISGSN